MCHNIRYIWNHYVRSVHNGLKSGSTDLAPVGMPGGGEMSGGVGEDAEEVFWEGVTSYLSTTDLLAIEDNVQIGWNFH